MTARADIVIDRVANATMVPLNCIYSEGKRRFVKNIILRRKKLPKLMYI